MLPLRGKVPAVDWRAFQRRRPTPQELAAWARDGLFENVGLVCGAVSGGLVVLDLDGEEAYRQFIARFPQLARTYTVLTGSGRGYHVYLIARNLPPSARALGTPLGHVELRADGLLVAAPPGLHPDTRQPYRVLRPLPIRRVPDLSAVLAWVEGLRPAPSPAKAAPAHPSIGNAAINPRLVAAIARRLGERGYRQKGVWLNGQCLYPERHAHHDRRPSFGYNARTGYGHCFVCGSMLTREVALRLGLDPRDYGGITAYGQRESGAHPRPERPHAPPQTADEGDRGAPARPARQRRAGGGGHRPG